MTKPEELRGRRQELGITQERLSKLTGIPSVSISAFENGRRKALA